MTSLASADLAAGIGGFFRWWRSELLTLVPRGWRRPLTGRNTALVVDAEHGLLAVRRRSNGAETLLARIDPDLDAAAARASLAGALAKGRRPHLILRLAPGDALVRRLDLPEIPEADLRAALRHEIERQSPLPRDKIVAGYEVRPLTGNGERKLATWLVTVPRERFARTLDLFTAIGCPVAVLEIREGSHTIAASLLEAQETESDTPSGAHRRVSLALFGVAAALALAALWIPLHRQESVAARLAEEVAQARRQADALPALEAELEARRAVARFLADKRRTLPRRIDSIADLTTLLPDSAWLTHLRIAGNDVQLSGYAADTAEILGLIEASPQFANVQFRASVTREADAGVERFEISAQMETQVDGEEAR